ncbi:MAG: hypothetical protein ACOZAL_03505 [Patescibacteria group bacterium]
MKKIFNLFKKAALFWWKKGFLVFAEFVLEKLSPTVYLPSEEEKEDPK